MVEHVFVLMLENRSFDHMLGFSRRQGIDALTGDPTELDALTGSESNRLSSGQEVRVSEGAPFSLTVDPGHEFDDVLEQLCGAGARYPVTGGRYPAINNSGFVSRLADQLQKSGVEGDPAVVMKVFAPDQLPVMHTLAGEFAVCDHWFSSLPGPTWPNRCFIHAASSGGMDDSPSLLRSATALLEGYKFQNGTIYDRLDAASLPWTVVEGDALPQVLSLAGMVERVVGGHFSTFTNFAARVNDPGFKDAYVFIEPHYGHVLSDGRNFKCGNSQHPLDDVTRGEKLLKDVYETVRNSPHWMNSALIVLYDEHGGFYDHTVPPAVRPPGDVFQSGNNHHGFNFDQLGVRVPVLVISPYTARGAIDHRVHDHTSVLATLEHLFGLQPLTKRDSGAPGVDQLFSLKEPRQDAPTGLPAPAVSGLPDCESDTGERLAGELETMPAHLGGQVEAALVGFLHVAVARELHLAAIARRDARDVGAAIDRERDRLLSTYDQIRTKFDAVKFIHEVQSRYEATRHR
ncbi:alkaline phosphatase family protein [Candidatus Nephthysia bennettiae]|uniref:Phosphoesterase n=1 Tax=Candidatus Nephthysia bennettiae TaxID=3127016 RepID=A0A934KD36_9BACT|nr:phosphoesterase [Candidatus Dormibacteraeota bacterium]MBJ7611542.1 phosphoesterase [Candidatus Dormibacteraeota bacterium]